jgi:hypothetical protein
MPTPSAPTAADRVGKIAQGLVTAQAREHAILPTYTPLEAGMTPMRLDGTLTRLDEVQRFGS